MRYILLLAGLAAAVDAVQHGWLDEASKIKAPARVHVGAPGAKPFRTMTKQYENPPEEELNPEVEEEPAPEADIPPEGYEEEKGSEPVPRPISIPKTPKKATNGTCRPEPKGHGPMPTDFDLDDTAEDWYELAAFTEIAEKATTPKDYKKLKKGTALFAAVEAIGFEGIAYLKSYNVSECASYCSERRECISFNTYFERNPLVEPAPGCPNPNATTMIKCVFWGNEIDSGMARNFGERREEFQVLVAGSNLYTKLNPGANLTHLGFNGPRSPRIKAVFEPPPEPVHGYNTTLGFQTYSYRLGFYYNPEICAKACLERTEADSRDKSNAPEQYQYGAYDKCNMFTSFELHKGGVPHAMVCVDYSAVWDNIYGTWAGGQSQDGSAYEPRLVEVYTRDDYEPPAICADEGKCGDRFYEGGDCSGWGSEYCRAVSQ